MPKIVLIVITPLVIAAIGTAYILGVYGLGKRLRLDVNRPWFATGVVGSFAALLYLAAIAL